MLQTHLLGLAVQKQFWGCKSVRMDHCQYSIKMLKGGQEHSSGTVRGWGRMGCKQGSRLDCTKT